LGDSVAISGDGNLVVAGGNRIIRIYKFAKFRDTAVGTWQEVKTLSSPFLNDIECLSISLDGRYFVAGELSSEIAYVFERSSNWSQKDLSARL